MDGLELLRRVHQNDADFPVILISAYGEISSAVDAMKSGAYDFLERPFDVEDLRARVRRALEKRELVLEYRQLKAELVNRPGLAAHDQREEPVLTGDDPQRLISYSWRGNVRELRNVAERSVLALGDGAFVGRFPRMFFSIPAGSCQDMAGTLRAEMKSYTFHRVISHA
jgi:DNA-binding NtrC family response regulator